MSWLAHFLQPWFEADVATTPEARVELEIDAGAYRAARRPAQRVSGDVVGCFLLDTRVVRHPIIRRELEWLWIDDRELGVVYAVDGRAAVRIIAPADGSGTRVALMRVVRELAMLDARAAGAPVLHAAVVARGRRAIAICGPKRSGKTSLLIHALREPSFRFVANDRAVVEHHGARATARGMPTIVALRADTIERFAHLAVLRDAPDRHWLTPSEAAEEGGRPWRRPDLAIDLTPARFCELAGAEPQADATLSAIIFPRVEPAAAGIGLERLTARDALDRLRGSFVGAALGGPQANAFAWHRTRSTRAARAVELETLRRLSELPCLSASMGRDASACTGLPDELLRLLD